MMKTIPRASYFISCAIFLFALTLHAADLRIIPLPSPSMRKNLHASIIIPSTYAKTAWRYPVIYLLHGYNGNSSFWPRIANLKQLSDSCQIMFVCPDGDNSWYFDSPINSSKKFETYITGEVIAAIDKKFRTWPEPSGRAIIGTSMGGHGALTLFARHPDLYCGAGSIAGIMDLAEFPQEWEIAEILGPFEQNRELWRRSSFTGQFSALKKLNKGIILDCGLSDFALCGNRKAHDLLLKAGIPHEYHERPGTHNGAYVAKTIKFHVVYLGRFLKAAR